MTSHQVPEVLSAASAAAHEATVGFDPLAEAKAIARTIRSAGNRRGAVGGAGTEGGVRELLEPVAAPVRLTLEASRL